MKKHTDKQPPTVHLGHLAVIGTSGVTATCDFPFEFIAYYLLDGEKELRGLLPEKDQ
ncbi:hypothetical protein Q0590_31130 [Rhodocytophaga aerolata]|uniref:Uncharacterized protein n=1 Tax=Rhodocytophaga aerolata TaxID=455078 RepID=A0ABT8RF87_9BACT|nr:hypothetical protein [Rhodocytophaga aerolata]MDO1450768.1 hypothetical protein [Rhodocytophaga aerolata]